MVEHHPAGAFWTTNEITLTDMRLAIEIDEGSGFCYGVIRAIEKAESRLKETSSL